MLKITAKATAAIKTMIDVETELLGADFAAGAGLKIAT